MQTASAPILDVGAIRSHFPALARVHEGRPVAYFDGPGGTQVPRAVVDAMTDYLLHHNANTHWRYPSSVETDAALGAARLALADFLNADASEIAFGQNMTTLTFHVSRALGRQWGPGDEIVVTELDHHANVDPWRALEKDRGVTIRTVKMRPQTGDLDWADLEDAIGARTKLVAIGGASNALGTVNDVRRASELAHAVGALAFVDAVHYAPHVLVDVREIGCDFLACSPYKFYGPHLGVLWGRRELLEAHGRAPARARAGLGARAAGDRDPLARGDRRRGGGRGFPGLARGGAGPRAQGRARGRLRTSSTRAGSGSSSASGMASARSRASRATGCLRTRPARRRFPSPSTGGPPTKWPRPWPAARSSRRAATSTPSPSCGASAARRTASCAQGAPVTRRRKKSSAWSRASGRSLRRGRRGGACPRPPLRRRPVH